MDQPHHAKAGQPTSVVSTYPTAKYRSPPSTKRSTSTAKVDIVVKAPSRPVPKARACSAQHRFGQEDRHGAKQKRAKEVHAQGAPRHPFRIG